MAQFFGGRNQAASRIAPAPDGSAADRPGGPARAWRLATGSRWAAGTWLGLLAATWIVKGQISAIVGEVTPTGQYPVTAVTGIGQLGSLTTPPHAALAAWDAATKHFPALASWLGWYLAADALFIGAGTLLGVTLLKGQPLARPAGSCWPRPPRSTPSRPPWPRSPWAGPARPGQAMASRRRWRGHFISPPS